MRASQKRQPPKPKTPPPNPPWTPFEPATHIPMSEAQMQEAAHTLGVDVQAFRDAAQERLTAEVWRNSRYQVEIDRKPTVGLDWPPMIHLSVKRIDRQPIHDWRDLQRIKNELVGPQNEGMELFPAEERRVDTANQYHLWVLTNPEERFPLGWTTRLVTDKSAGGAVQRPREDAA
jgi:hypothetical protein